MIRGLVQELSEGVVPKYQVTVEFVRHLGLRSVSELPEYESLSTDENMARVLSAQAETQGSER